MPIPPIVRGVCVALAVAFAPSAWAQAPQPQGQQQGAGPQHGRPPPPHAYTDCRGKKAGDVVQHATPNGTGPATCMDSPEGLVARPNPPPGAPPPPPGPPPAPQR
ncbi:hypothetical protein [Azospirillum sp. sgz301742]